MKQYAYNKAQTVLVAAIKILCKPLIRLLIEKGITFTQFRDLMKTLYVDVADEHFSLDSNKSSDSRIFVLTGVHRKDIKRIRQQTEHPEQPITSSASLSGEIIARWCSMPEYLDKQGKPRQLHRTNQDNTLGFDNLVSSINKDVRPKVILDEWLRQKIVNFNDDVITLNQSAFVSNKEFNEMAYYLKHNIHDHLASCVNNILEENQPMLERSVYYSALTKESINKLKNIANKKGNELLQHLNKQAIVLYDADKNKPDANNRMRLGVYWYQTQLEKERESES